MKTAFLKKSIIWFLIFSFVTGIMRIGKIYDVSAASKPGKPVINVHSDADQISVTIGIGRTTGAKGYRIAMKAPGESSYIAVATLRKNGKEERSFTLENLSEGEYFFKVKAYTKEKGKKVWGSYSRACSIILERVTEKSEEPETDKYGFSVGDIVTFGSYEQDGDPENGSEPIEWMVLETGGGKLYLLSRYVLDEGNINEFGNFNCTWAKSELREWLNNVFLKKAFNEEEARILVSTKLYDTRTVDKVFLLSEAEADKFKNIFYTEEDRKCAPTKYAKDRSVWSCGPDYPGEEHKTKEGEDTCFWWLRTGYGSEDGDFAIVSETGLIRRNCYWGEEMETVHEEPGNGKKYYAEGFGIRPAIKVNINEETLGFITKTGKNVAKVLKTSAELKDVITDIYSAQNGDIIKFGSYEQDNNPDNGKESIRWVVLSRTDTEIFAISRFGLDVMPYNEKETFVSWADCSLRNWLNNDFYDTAFSDKEKRRIKPTWLKNNENLIYGTEGGEDTLDKVFLLSIEEATSTGYGFNGPTSESDPLRQCMITDFVLGKDVRISATMTENGIATALSWLRSPGSHTTEAAYVTGAGAIRTDGWAVTRSKYVVRPAVVISLV